MVTTASEGRTPLIAVPRFDVRLAAGIVLIAASVAGGLVLWNSVRETAPVLVAARDIP